MTNDETQACGELNSLAFRHSSFVIRHWRGDITFRSLVIRHSESRPPASTYISAISEIAGTSTHTGGVHTAGAATN